MKISTKERYHPEAYGACYDKDPNIYGFASRTPDGATWGIEVRAETELQFISVQTGKIFTYHQRELDYSQFVYWLPAQKVYKYILDEEEVLVLADEYSESLLRLHPIIIEGETFYTDENQSQKVDSSFNWIDPEDED